MAENGARGCECGKVASCTDSRPTGPYTRRRYRCRCGNRWSTLEMRADLDGRTLRAPDAVASVVARVTVVLQELIQEISKP